MADPRLAARCKQIDHATVGRGAGVQAAQARGARRERKEHRLEAATRERKEHRCGAGGHLGVGRRAQVAVEEGGGGVEQLPQLVGVGQVAVVDEVDAERGVDEEGLRLLGGGRPGGGVPHVADAAGAWRQHGEAGRGEGAVSWVEVSVMPGRGRGAPPPSFSGSHAYGARHVERRMRQGPPSAAGPAARLTHELVEGLLRGEDVLDKPVGLELEKLLVVGGHDAGRVLPPMLQHQQALVDLRVGGALLLVHANDAAHARRHPARGAAVRRPLSTWRSRCSAGCWPPAAGPQQPCTAETARLVSAGRAARDS